MDIDERGNVPEEFDGHLESNSLVLCCTFNRLGTLLAGGCNDGKVIIWDFLTRCEVREIQAHAFTVTSVVWSRDGRWLATTSLDNTLAVWDIYPNAKDPPENIVRWTLSVPIMRAQFHPKNKNFVLVCPYKHVPILVKISDQNNSLKYRKISAGKDEDTDSNTVASFDRCGKYIYTGSARGCITIFESPTDIPDEDEDNAESLFRVVSSFKIPQVGVAPAAIRDIEFGPKNDRYFLVNATDRSIRLYRCDKALESGFNGACEEEKKFQDLVNKPLWKKCCFSGEEEVKYVCGGSASKHAIYIWDIEEATVKKMFQPPSKGEALMDVQWHPTKPMVVSVSNGLIFIWARAEVENWSAYAPTFEELDENQEYDERESEFDIEDEDALLKSNPNNDVDMDDNISIDVISVTRENEDNKKNDIDDSDVLDLIPLPFADVERMHPGHTQ